MGMLLSRLAFTHLFDDDTCPGFFLPVRVLSRVYSWQVHLGLERLFRKDWIVYAKRASCSRLA